MPWLDTRTVMFSYLISGVLCVIVLSFYWLRNRKRGSGPAFWVLGYAFLSLATILILARGAVPDWVSVTLANVILVVGVALVLAGLGRYVGRVFLVIPNIVLLALFAAAYVYFAHFKPDLKARTMALSLVLAVLSLEGVGLMGRGPRHDLKRAMALAGAVFAAIGLVSLVRFGGVIAGLSPGSDFFKPAPFEALILLSYQMLFLSMTFALALMVNDRLISEVRLQEEKFTKAFRSAPYALALTRESDGRLLDVNDGFEQLSGYSREEAVGRTTQELAFWENEEERRSAVSALVAEGRIRDLEVRFRKKSGELIIGLWSAESISIDGRSHILSSISDITERKRNEEALAQSVREKELLMRELRHRVKNSLAVVSSLLNLSREATSDPGVQRVFADLRSRIGSVSAVYEQLDRTGRADIIHLREYIQALVESLNRSYGPSDRRVRIATRLEDLTLETRKALPLGLILNELIINAFKYAYPEGSAGEIRVALTASAGGMTLIVDDDGVGFPATPEAPKGEGTGTKLIELLAGQIEAQISRLPGPGAKVVITF